MDNTLKMYPSNKRLFKSAESEYEGWLSNSCIFGIAHQNNPLPSIDKIPIQTTNFYMYFGEGNLDIIQYLIKNKINENLEQLSIGFENGNSSYGYKDYSKISKLLSTTSFPRLKNFEFGIDFLLVNGSQYYPHLGDLTHVLSKMPILESLSLHGSFELTKSVDLKNVSEFYVLDYWTEISNGIISTETFNFLLDSEFQNLNDFEISLTTDNNLTYTFNENLLLKNLEKLKCVDIDGKFEVGTRARLFQILNSKVEKLLLDDIQE